MRGSRNHLLHLAKKKKRIQDIIDNISDYNSDSIASLTGVPSWAKKHLLDMVVGKVDNEGNEVDVVRATIIANEMIQATQNDNKYPECEIYEYRGGNQYLGGIETVYGDYVMVLPDKNVKINTHHAIVSEHKIASIKKMSVRVGTMCLPEYNKAVQKLIETRNVLTVETDYSLGAIMARGVKIGR